MLSNSDDEIETRRYRAMIKISNPKFPKPFWQRIGVAYEEDHPEKGIRLKVILNSLPVKGEFFLFEDVPAEERHHVADNDDEVEAA